MTESKIAAIEGPEPAGISDSRSSVRPRRRRSPTASTIDVPSPTMSPRFMFPGQFPGSERTGRHVPLSPSSALRRIFVKVYSDYSGVSRPRGAGVLWRMLPNPHMRDISAFRTTGEG